MKKLKKQNIILISVYAVCILANIISRISQGFSEFYVSKVYPYIMSFFSRIAGVFPFSTGEIFIIIGVLLIVLCIPLFIILMIFSKKRRCICRIYALAAAWIGAYILTTETFNCFIMYQCKPFSDKYFSESVYTSDSLERVYRILAENSDRLAKKVSRDENGSFKLMGDTYEEAKTAMKNLGKTYPQFKGYYPDPKPIRCSYFMSQQYLLGIYFPFTLEANYNRDVCDINIPNTLCHELAHLKGCIQEDEAGFIAFIACINSDSTELQYSGYLNALEYVHNEISKQGIQNECQISELVWKDLYKFVPDGYWKENKSKEVVSTETVSAVSDAAMDTSLKMNGVDDGIKSYDRMVNLLIDYYCSTN